VSCSTTAFAIFHNIHVWHEINTSKSRRTMRIAKAMKRKSTVSSSRGEDGLRLLLPIVLGLCCR
jgi:hypothetical protein